MSFRRRITIVSAAAVAIAVILASLLTYVLTSNQLHRQVDKQLRDRGQETGRLIRFLNRDSASAANTPGAAATASAAKTPSAAATPSAAKTPSATATPSAQASAANTPGAAAPGPAAASGAAAQTKTPSKAGGRRGRGTTSGSGNLFGHLPPNPDEVRGYQQVIAASGKILLRSSPRISLPVDAATSRLAAQGGSPFFRDAVAHATHLRVFAESFGSGRAVQIALPLTEVDSLLARLRLILVVLDVGGIALAALLGRLVAGAAVQPLRRLSETTEHVAVTRDLSRRITTGRGDEIGRLAVSFNAMLDALERSVSALDASVDAQRQLVADASHELRTPVTSLRTNIEILQQQGSGMSSDDHERLLSDVVEQIEELTLLINDLIDLAKGEEPHQETEEVRLDLLIGEVVDRARRRAPATPMLLDLAPTLLTGVPMRLERAVGNLIDNAVKYSPPGEPVEVELRGKTLTVRDHGPGITAEDLPHIFDRFYRGAEARGRPGSGLGLAIVRQVATQQSGSIAAESAPGGDGTLMRLRLPGAEAAEEAGGRRIPVAAGDTRAA